MTWPKTKSIYTLLLQDIVITFILASIFGIGGILAAYMAVQWVKLEDNNSVRDAIGGADALFKTRDVLAATSVSKQKQLSIITNEFFFFLQGTSLFAALFLSFLMTWVIFFLVQKWNDKVIKETVKSAI